jgi:hypothetical protein
MIHLVDAGGAPLCPDFCGDEGLFACVLLGQQIAGNFFGAAVHGRAIQDRTAERKQVAENVAELVSVFPDGADVKPFVCAYADDGQRFAG